MTLLEDWGSSLFEGVRGHVQRREVKLPHQSFVRHAARTVQGRFLRVDNRTSYMISAAGIVQFSFKR